VAANGADRAVCGLCAATASRLVILALIAVYRISDVVMGIMANPFYVDMGYTKDEVAAVTKIYGVVIMTLVGALRAVRWPCALGDAVMLGAVLSAASNRCFAWLGSRGVNALIFVISADNLASGIASAASSPTCPA
jgi:PAT family beta-lactamase induction signal transducer AmpG